MSDENPSYTAIISDNTLDFIVALADAASSGLPSMSYTLLQTLQMDLCLDLIQFDFQDHYVQNLDD